MMLRERKREFDDLAGDGGNGEVEAQVPLYPIAPLAARVLANAVPPLCRVTASRP